MLTALSLDALAYDVISCLGNWGVAFRDTCAEAKRFFGKYKSNLVSHDHSKACEKIISVKTKLRASAVKGSSKSKSVLFDTCILAKQLQRLEKWWEVMDRMWVELLSYAAVNCRSIVHAQQPSKGGELLTFTWLLMNHMGLGFHFSEEEQDGSHFS
ncbi:hypothetical protein L484_013837 [Morus notabilis]|uniref:DUF4220 domain-containing protein n=1 Tax=Morus notabilis TaxID=981085 RepID=W9SAT8_9ROSA|nr:hypothetical protein L484_013837 [Morus notabilis]